MSEGVWIKEEKGMEDIDFFKTGWRVIIMLLRQKDGGHNRPDYHAKKYLVNGVDEFNEKFTYLKDLKRKESAIPYRIYSSVNERDMNKAIRHFKQEQLDRDYDCDEIKHRFYVDIKNRFIGSAQRPQSRKSSYFLFDIDFQNPEDKIFVMQLKAHLRLDVYAEIIYEYETPHGYHIITKPFNYKLLEENVYYTIKKDAMMLLEW